MREIDLHTYFFQQLYPRLKIRSLRTPRKMDFLLISNCLLSTYYLGSYRFFFSQQSFHELSWFCCPSSLASMRNCSCSWFILLIIAALLRQNYWAYSYKTWVQPIQRSFSEFSNGFRNSSIGSILFLLHCRWGQVCQSSLVEWFFLVHIDRYSITGCSELKWSSYLVCFNACGSKPSPKSTHSHRTLCESFFYFNNTEYITDNFVQPFTFLLTKKFLNFSCINWCHQL